MKINESEYKNIIAKYFDYTGDFTFLDVVATAIDRLDNLKGDDEDKLREEILDEVYWRVSIYSDAWTVAIHYNSSPKDMDWDKTFEEFTDDIFSIVAEIRKAI